jgi:hypothetical protein
MSEAAEPRGPYSIVQQMTPIDIPVQRRADGGNEWYRVPSWKVEFAGEQLKGLDIRIHKSLNAPTGWALSEATTGFALISLEECDSKEFLDWFCDQVLPGLTRTRVEAAIAGAHERLRSIPPRTLQ